MKFLPARAISPIISSLCITEAFLSLAAHPSFAADTPPTSEEQKVLYAIGLAVSRSLSVFNLTPSELEFVKEGLTDAVAGRRPVVELTAYNDKVQELARARRKAMGDKLAVSGKEFIEKAAKEKGAVKTDTGLVYLSLKEGSGESPKSTDTVKVNYRGTLTGGKAKLVCPASLAYGEAGAGDLILPGATLVFEVELLEFKK